MDGWVYVIIDSLHRMNVGYVKIGVTLNPLSWLKQLQTGNPKKLYIDKMYFLPNRASADYVERRMHELLESFRCSGEWFVCEPDMYEKINGFESFIGDNLAYIQGLHYRDYLSSGNYTKWKEYNAKK